MWKYVFESCLLFSWRFWVNLYLVWEMYVHLEKARERFVSLTEQGEVNSNLGYCKLNFSYGVKHFERRKQSFSTAERLRFCCWETSSNHGRSQGAKAPQIFRISSLFCALRSGVPNTILLFFISCCSYCLNL